jgi:hypothetical protein
MEEKILQKYKSLISRKYIEFYDYRKEKGKGRSKVEEVMDVR